MTIQSTTEEGYRQVNWLVSLGFDTVVYLTDSDIPILYDGETYQPTSINTVSIPLESSGGPCKVIIADDGTLDEAETSEDAAGLTMTVSKIYDLDTALVSLEWTGLIEDWQTTDRHKVSIAGVAWGLLRIGPGLPLLTDVCVHQFNGTGCGYAGVLTTCNGTLTECQTRSNDDRFVSAFCAPIAGTVVWIQGQRYTVPAGGSSYPQAAPGGGGWGSGAGHVDMPQPPPVTS